MKCLICEDPDTFSRSLCAKHYFQCKRDGSLEEYPTIHYTRNPEQMIRWAFAHNPDMVADIAVEFGLRVERR